jgi:hypothetical protein
MAWCRGDRAPLNWDVRPLMERRCTVDLADGAHGPGDVPPFVVSDFRTVLGPDLPNWQRDAVLASVENPFDWRGHLVRFITFSTRYSGDSLSKILTDGGIVGVGRIATDVDPRKWERLDPQFIEYWGVGVMKRLEV